MSTPEQRVIHCAIAWRETEKSAIGAQDGEKSAANKKHDEAKKNLRKAVDNLIGGKP